MRRARRAGIVSSRRHNQVTRMLDLIPAGHVLGHEHDAVEVGVQRVTAVERAGVLGEGIEELTRAVTRPRIGAAGQSRYPMRGPIWLWRTSRDDNDAQRLSVRRTHEHRHTKIKLIDYRAES
jgi:hypothetical protein